MHVLPRCWLQRWFLLLAWSTPHHSTRASHWSTRSSLPRRTAAPISPLSRRAGGVTGYYCVCLGPDNKPAPNTKTLKLDTFGKAEIRSVFYAALDRDNAPEHQTMLILLRLDGKPGLRAYRYNDNSDICYHPNGKVASSFTFRNGKATDCGKKFDDTGKQTSPGPEGCPPPKKPHFIFGE